MELIVETSVSDICVSYKKLLAQRHADYLIKFISRVNQYPDGARLEAVVYSIMRSFGLRVQIEEDPRSGGADFICHANSGSFVLEVTTIHTSAMERKTELEQNQTGVLGGFYRPYPTLYKKLLDKAKQVSKYSLPRVVGVGTFHNEAKTLLRPVMADEYLGVFTVDEKSKLIPNICLKDISAFLLIGVAQGDFIIVGFLNPVPSVLFDTRYLPDTQFRQLTKTGLNAGTGQGQWVKAGNIVENAEFPSTSLTWFDN
jgi:hypothetical protein